MDIKIVALDMDGTLLNSQHQLSPRNEAALAELHRRGIPIVFATGKTRHSAVPIIERLGLKTPGVYVQGLLIANADGSVRYQRTLDQDLAEEIAQFAAEMDCAMVAYAGNRIITDQRNELTDIFIRYHEPTPEPYGSWEAAFAATPVNKFIIISTRAGIDQMRPQLEARVNGRATVVQALDYMVEILPHGASKGDGVRRLLEELNIDPQNMLAIGDGENDIEMLQMAGIGVAMGNAMPSARAAADYITTTNDEDGVAAAIERFVLEKGIKGS